MPILVKIDNEKLKIDDSSANKDNLKDVKHISTKKKKKNIKSPQDGSKYIGEWEHGKKHGVGTCYYQDGSADNNNVKISRYAGQWKDDKRSGKGVQHYKDGSKYIGEWKEDKKHGKGVYYYKDGSKYIGEWQNDNIENQTGSIFIAVNGNISIGENNDYNKHTTHASSPSTVPTGEYITVKKSKKENTMYIGTYNNANEEKNKIVGTGLYICKNDDMNIGEFSRNKKHGKGVYYRNNGNRYIGEWKDGKLGGQVLCDYVGGVSYEGEWRDGTRNGKGSCYYNNSGNMFEGSWKDGKRNGEGCILL